MLTLQFPLFYIFFVMKTEKKKKFKKNSHKILSLKSLFAYLQLKN